jgi:hypothetical protein
MFMLVVFSALAHISRAHPALESYEFVVCTSSQNCVSVDGRLAAVLVTGEEGFVSTLMDFEQTER